MNLNQDCPGGPIYVEELEPEGHEEHIPLSMFVQELLSLLAVSEL